MRRQNFCFEKGKFIATTYELKQLGIRFGFDPDTVDYIPDSIRDIDNPTNP